MRGTRFLSSLTLLTFAAGVSFAGEVPVAVSPGKASQQVSIASPCPTFSWGTVEGADAYELVVYRVGDEGEEPPPVLREGFAGSVSGWTPSLDRCLEPGRRYAWRVLAVVGAGPTEWSPPNLFEVASAPSPAELEAALEIVRRHLHLPGRTSPERAAGASGETTVPETAGPLAQQPESASHDIAPAGDPAIQIEGAAVITTATIGAAIASIDRECPGALASGDRYTDCGNGTVRDNFMGLYWLRDASCDALGPHGNGTGTVDEGDTAAAALADGTCGLADGSAAGSWRLPSIYELCSAHVVTGNICPASAAPTSLVDSSVGPPTVVNAAGIGVWTSGDAFVDVASNPYWATRTNIRYIDAADLTDGTIYHLDLASVPAPTDYYIWPVRE